MRRWRGQRHCRSGKLYLRRTRELWSYLPKGTAPKGNCPALANRRLERGTHEERGYYVRKNLGCPILAIVWPGWGKPATEFSSQEFLPRRQEGETQRRPVLSRRVALPLRSQEVSVEFDGRRGSHQTETHIAPAFIACRKTRSTKHCHLVVQPMPIMLHLVNAGFWNFFGWLKNFISHHAPSPEIEFMEHRPPDATQVTARKGCLVVLRQLHSGRLPAENKFRFKSSGFRPNCSASSLIFTSSFISASPISSTC
jgi:hypothetical protein